MDIFNIVSEYWTLTPLLILFISCIFLYTLKSSKPPMAAPPSPPKLPIIGNLHQILGKPRHEALWQLSKQYGPLMQIHIGSKPFLIISSPEFAKQILKTQDHIFCSRPISRACKRLSYDYMDVAFTPQSGHWREMRKIIVSEFTGPKRAKQFNRALVAEMESVICSLSAHPPNTEVNLSHMFFEIMKQMVCKVTFGNKYRAQLPSGQSLDVMVKETLELLNGSVGDSFPFLGFFIDYFSGWNRKMNDGSRNLDAYIQAIIDDHVKDKVEELSEDDKDFVHTLLDMQSCSEKLASGYQLKHAELKALIMDIIAGGMDTTSLTLTWAMSEINRNARVMKKLQSEIRNCMGRIEKVDELDTRKMKYLKMVVKETLRLHAPGPLLIPHESLSDTQIEGYDVVCGTTVIFNAWGIGRDPSNWGENADEFYPERFENVDDDFGRDRFEMLPFGGGRRSCPAMNMAPANVELVLATLLYWFNWEFAGGELNMEEDGGTLVLGKKVPLSLIPTKHKWEDIN